MLSLFILIDSIAHEKPISNMIEQNNDSKNVQWETE